MKLCCINQTLEITTSKSIKINLEEFKFWLERFIPNLEYASNKPKNFTLFIKNCKKNKCIVNEDNIILQGQFNPNCESFLAKFISQIFAKLLIENDYHLVQAACVAKNNKALLIVGDFGQGKTSLSFELFNKYDCNFISDNYVIIHKNKVIAGTKHLSFRQENIKYLNEQKQKSIFKKNNRYFFPNDMIKREYPICGIITPHINSDDNNIHIMSKEESTWYLYGKFSRILNGECILFNGIMPSPILNNYNSSNKILSLVNNILNESSIHYLSSDIKKMCDYIDKHILFDGIDYNFAIKLTTYCPGNCACCKHRKDNFIHKHDNNNFFNLDTFEKICNCIKKIGGKYIALSGGEPTIVPNLEQYIRLANDKGLSVRLNTSGWGITEEKLNKWLDCGLSQIVLSVYGINPETVDETRGNKLMYQKTREAIKIIYKIRKQRNFIFIMQSVIMKNNYREIPDIFELALENEADMFWPSYLEDAINLDSIRLSSKDIEIFKSRIIPYMKEKVISNKKYNKIKESIFEDLEKIYNQSYPDYIYHQENNYSCPWPGKHFTFYPNGVIDPCPGHEYFKSEYQWKIDYNNIEDFFTKENISKNTMIQYDYCKYCPQGEHKAINLTCNKFHEHAKKEDKK